MPALRRLAFLIVFMLAAAAAAKADAVLVGSVSFDPTTNLYTYSYTIDNTAGPAPITSLNLRTNVFPVSHTAPPGWLYSTNAAAAAGPPLNVVGRLVTWGSGNGLGTNGVPVGGILSGFSITTPYAPLATGENNFYLVSLEFDGGPPGFPRFVTYGNVVGPSLPTPEPSALLLLGTGIAGLTTALLRRRRG